MVCVNELTGEGIGIESKFANLYFQFRKASRFPYMLAELTDGRSLYRVIVTL